MALADAHRQHRAFTARELRVAALPAERAASDFLLWRSRRSLGGYALLIVVDTATLSADIRMLIVALLALVVGFPRHAARRADECRGERPCCMSRRRFSYIST
jgi:hypothetical protein